MGFLKNKILTDEQRMDLLREISKNLSDHELRLLSSAIKNTALKKIAISKLEKLQS